MWRAECVLMELKVFFASTNKSSFSVFISNNLFHCIYSSFTATVLTCVQLKRSCSIFNIFLQDPQNCLANYASGNLSNANWSHSRALANEDEAACNKSSETIRMYSSSGYTIGNICQSSTKICGGRLKRVAHTPPCLGIKI